MGYDMIDKLQVLRTIDKADRMPPDDVFSLLTTGRKDKSGDFTPGCAITNGQAMVIVGFVFGTKYPKINSRLRMMVALEDKVIDDTGRTAWDVLLDAYAAMPDGPEKDIGWILDDLIKATQNERHKVK